MPCVRHSRFEHSKSNFQIRHFEDNDDDGDGGDGDGGEHHHRGQF